MLYSMTHINMLSRLRIDVLLRHHNLGTKQLHFLSCTYLEQDLMKQARMLCQKAWINKEKSCPSNRKTPLSSAAFFHSSAACSSRESNNPALKPSEITESLYDARAEETLDSLTEYFEDLPESETCNDDYDCAYGAGVLTVHLGSVEGTYVINKQSPNKQIWLSSPLSGPKRFDYVDGQWVYLRDGKGLHHLLEEELTELLGFKIELKKCKYYSWGTPDSK